MTTATSKYASIRKDIAKDTLLRKYDPEYVFWNSKNQRMTYKTEAGFRKAMEKRYKDETAIIDMAEAIGTPIEGQVTVTKSNGSPRQAKAYLTYIYLDKNGRISEASFKTGYTSGGGYDKESTAITDVFNKSPGMVKILLDARVKKAKIPYGASLNIGQPELPTWDWGVGASALMNVLNALGYNAKKVYTPTSDTTIYTFTKKRKVAAEKGRA